MPARRKSGFTLIELLVVIAIIAILAAILFPVFARAREQARKSQCSNNIRECALAVQLYYNEYDATLPSSLLATTNGAGGSQIGFLSTIGQVPPLPGVTPTTWPMLLYDHMKSKDIMWCPSDSSDHTATSGPVSYWWKYAADAAWIDPNVKAQKEGDFTYNSDQIIFYEHLAWHYGDTSGLHSGTNASQINVAFMDSHVKTISLFDCATGTPLATVNTHPDATSNKYEPFWYNYNNNVAYQRDSNPPKDGTQFGSAGTYDGTSYANEDPHVWSDHMSP